MKQLLLILIAATCSHFAVYSQCVPDISITAPGIYPDVLTNLPTGTAGVFYDTDIQVRVLTDTTIAPGLDVTVDDITIDSVSGLPAGFSYSSNPSSGIFPGGSNGCLRLYGTNAVAGTYLLTVYVTLNGSLFGFPVSQQAPIPGYQIVLNAPVTPVAQFSAAASTICEDNTIIFTDQSLNNPTSWFWTFQGGTLPTSTDQNPEVLYSTPGTYDVTLVATNAAGSDTLVQMSTIVVNAKPVAKITPTTSIQICSGQNALLTANAGTGLTYQWFRYGNLLAGETNQTINTTIGGNYKVKVTNSANGCTKKSSWRTIQVNTLPVVTVTPQGPTTFCKDSSVVLETVLTPGNAYQWSAGGVDIPGAVANTYLVTQSEYYRVRATDPNGCSKLSPGTVVTVLKLPNNSITASGPLTFCQGDSVVLNASPVVGNTFQWEQNFAPLSGQTADSYTAYTSGKYTFTVTGSNGCSRRSAVRKVDINCRQASQYSNLVLDLSVYPNPASDYVQLELTVPEDGVVAMEMYDISGRMVTEIYRGTKEKGYYTFEMDTHDFPKGIYFLRTTINNQTLASRLVIN